MSLVIQPLALYAPSYLPPTNMIQPHYRYNIPHQALTHHPA